MLLVHKKYLLTKNLIKVCSIPEIVDILENWDTKVTDEFLKNMSKEKEIRDNEVRKKKEFETKKYKSILLIFNI